MLHGSGETYVRPQSISSESAVKYLHVGRRKIQIINFAVSCTYQRYAGGGGRAWGGALIVFVGPGVGHLPDPVTDLVLPGEGIFESSFARRGDI